MTDEGCLVDVTGIYFYLVESRAQVERTVPYSTGKSVETRVDARQRVGVLLGDVVDFPVVDAEPDAAIFLFDQDYV